VPGPAGAAAPGPAAAAGRGPGRGGCCAGVPGPTPNGLLPGRAGRWPGPVAGRGPGRGPPWAGAAGRSVAGGAGVDASGTAGAGRGPGRGPGVGPGRRCSVAGAGDADAAARAAAACACWAAFNSAARACSALTSMSWALAVPCGRAIDAGDGMLRGGRGPLGGPGLRPPPLPPDDGETYASRNRRATGASIVDDADFTNSPSSFSLFSTSLLGTPSSLASSCTRALPATALLFRGRAARPARPSSYS